MNPLVPFHCMKSVRQISDFLKPLSSIHAKLKTSCRHYGSFYPIDDTLFGFTDEQKQLRKTTFDFLQKELAPYVDEIDKTDRFSRIRDFHKKCGELGLTGVKVDPEFGGSGLGYFEYCLIGEEFSRVSSAVSMSFGAHSNLCLNQLSNCGTQEQKEKYIPKVYARTDPKAVKVSKAITAFLVEKSFEGFSIGKPVDKLGMRGSGTAELIFENCRVPASNVLGGVNKGVPVLFSGLDIERLIVATGPIGIMQACCDVAFEYVHNRKQFNTRIGEFQLMQGKIADMYADLNACRSYLYTALRACDNGHINSKDCAAVALFCSEKATQVALQAIQCLGGNGYINDYPTGRFLRDAKLYEIGAGTNEIRRSLIGRIINSEYSHISKL